MRMTKSQLIAENDSLRRQLTTLKAQLETERRAPRQSRFNFATHAQDLCAKLGVRSVSMQQVREYVESL